MTIEWDVLNGCCVEDGSNVTEWDLMNGGNKKKGIRCFRCFQSHVHFGIGNVYCT